LHNGALNWSVSRTFHRYYKCAPLLGLEDIPCEHGGSYAALCLGDSGFKYRLGSDQILMIEQYCSSRICRISAGLFNENMV